MVWRGGRDSNGRSATKRDETSIHTDHDSAATSPANAARVAKPTHAVTSCVPAIGLRDHAAKLRAAADALRSGRVDQLTSEWREELAAACEDAAGTIAAERKVPR